MPIRTNLASLTPRRQAYRREITLLSKGFSNPKAWPGGKLVVYPWDSEVDQVVLTVGRKANTSEVMYAVLAKVCDFNGASIDDFVFSEIETVLLVARAIAGGGTIQYQAVCPSCRHTSQEKIQVPDELEKVGEKPDDYTGHDDITLPECKDVVTIRPILIRDNKSIEARLGDPLNTVEEHILRLVTPIQGVNGGAPDNLEEVLNWYRAISPADARHLETQEVLLSPKLQTLIPHTCDACGKGFKQGLLFDREFFR